MAYQKKVIQWLEEFIIGMNICPFAKAPWEQGQILLQGCEKTEESAIIKSFNLCLEELETNGPFETCLFYLPHLPWDYLDFNDFSQILEDELLTAGLEEKYQLVVFHPGFYFADTDPHDLANYVNRSPYPLIHILKRLDIERAINNFEDAQKISYINEKKIKKLDPEILRRIFWYL